MVRRLCSISSRTQSSCAHLIAASSAMAMSLCSLFTASRPGFVFGLTRREEGAEEEEARPPSLMTRVALQVRWSSGVFTGSGLTLTTAGDPEEWEEDRGVRVRGG